MDIVSEFIKSARRFSSNIAVWTKDGSISYELLYSQAKLLSQYLKSCGINKSDRVALILDRKMDAIIGIMGILMSGASHVPIDPKWPNHRIKRILNRCKINAIICDTMADDIKNFVNIEIEMAKGNWKKIENNKDIDKGFGQANIDPDNTAYIFNTSGSTGDPKAVEISHKAAIYFANWAKNEFVITEKDRIGSVSPFTFDLSTFDIFTSLISGAAIYLADDETRILPTRLSHFLERHCISVLYAVPTTLSLLISRGLLSKRKLHSLRLIMFAGEIFPHTQLKQLIEILSNTEFYNLYGPTETNVCTLYKVTKEEDVNKIIPIGKPLPGTIVSILPAKDAVTDGCEIGELCVSGPGVMSGYYSESKKMADSWIKLSEYNNRLAYRTGDIVERGNDDNLIFKGRKDMQIKHMGYRIDVCEIEKCLQKHEDVCQAIVVQIQKKKALSKLFAYVTCRQHKRLNTKRITKMFAYLQKLLPAYMLPNKIIEVDKMPLTHSGKIDRNYFIEKAKL